MLGRDDFLDAARMGLAVASAMVSCWTVPCGAQEKDARKATEAERVVITGPKPPADEEVSRRVEAALEANPYLDASRLTISTKDGVVRLEGIVGDVSDLRRALRTASRVPGTRRIEEDLYVPDFDNGP